jgi:hypothetical protein
MAYVLKDCLIAEQIANGLTTAKAVFVNCGKHFCVKWYGSCGCCGCGVLILLLATAYPWDVYARTVWTVAMYLTNGHLDSGLYERSEMRVGKLSRRFFSGLTSGKHLIFAGLCLLRSLPMLMIELFRTFCLTSLSLLNSPVITYPAS